MVTSMLPDLAAVSRVILPAGVVEAAALDGEAEVADFEAGEGVAGVDGIAVGGEGGHAQGAGEGEGDQGFVHEGSPVGVCVTSKQNET